MFRRKGSMKKSFDFPIICEEIAHPKSINGIREELRKQYENYSGKEEVLQSFPFLISSRKYQSKTHIRAQCKSCKCCLNWSGT